MKTKVIAIHKGRTAQIWRAGGMIWLISVSFFFSLLILYFAKLSMLLTLSIGSIVFFVPMFLLIGSIKSLQLAKKLFEDKSEIGSQKRVGMKKWFLIVLAIEIVGLNIASIALWKSNHFPYIVPVDILIVALHFIHWNCKNSPQRYKM